MAVTWECPQCRRRVPAALQECRCGASRPQPAAPGRLRPRRGPGDIAGPSFSWREVPRSVKLAVAFAVLATVGGVLWLILVPVRLDPVPALLGYVDRAAPTPPPTTAPAKPSPEATPLVEVLPTEPPPQ